MVELYPGFPAEYAVAAKKLHEHYFAIENDGNMSVEEKQPHMLDWYRKGTGLMVENANKMGKDFDVAKIAADGIKKGKCMLRRGVGCCSDHLLLAVSFSPAHSCSLRRFWEPDAVLWQRHIWDASNRLPACVKCVPLRPLDTKAGLCYWCKQSSETENRF